MPMISNWLKVAVSGQTADGRNIPAQWLTEMAETYSMDEYTALIWWEHERNYGDDGKVYALKTEKDEKGRVCLFAKLQPSVFLQQSSKRRTLFTSIEPSNKNFAGSGKRYLMGLAYTDEPASLGTDQLLFSAKGDKFKNHDDNTSEWHEFDLAKADAVDSDDEAPSWFKKLLPNLFNNQRHEDDESGDDEMNKEQFEQFMAKQDENHAAMMEQFKAITPVTASDDENDADGGNSEEMATLNERFNKLETENAELKADNKKFKKKFKKLKNAEVDSTDADDADAVEVDDLP